MRDMVRGIVVAGTAVIVLLALTGAGLAADVKVRLKIPNIF